MNTLIKQAYLLGGLLACSGMALAIDKVDYVDLAKGDGINIMDGKIFINPINGNYGQATSSTMSYHLRAKAGCKGQNVIKNFFVSLGSENVNKYALEASNNYRQTVPGQAYSESVPWTEVAMKVPLTKLGFNPAAMCQANLNQKISQGASKQQVMAQDQVLSKGVWFTTVAQCGRIGKSNDQYGSKYIGAELKIICKAGSTAGVNNIQVQTPDPKPGQGSFQAPIKVNYASFRATPKVLNTTCPARAKFTGKIGVTGPGTVKYRVKFPDNTYSSIRTLKFDKAGTRSIGTPEYQTNHSLVNETAVLEVLEPQEKKVFTQFTVNCIAAQGPGSIQLQPGQNAAPGTGKVKAAPSVKVEPIKAKPVRRVESDDTEEEASRR